MPVGMRRRPGTLLPIEIAILRAALDLATRGAAILEV